ncbi:MAG: F0F1 ATP synthase subunit B [Betaproteobacteria bacterium]|nr:F0F1 ATP synthase subunit B [Betaproteobacteria bacterium]
MNFNLTLVAQAITFAIFIWFSAKFVWPPLLAAIETRQKTIADGLSAAERGRLELEQASKKSTDSLREGKQQAAAMVAAAEKRAAEIVEEAKSAARVEAERIVEAARGQVEQDVQRAREDLRERVAELAVAGAERILRREVDAKAHSELLAGLKKEL